MYQLKSLEITNIISFKKQEFQFRNGKAVLIVGKNLDDPSQEGNGAGKSSLIEAVALAFTGTSIRDVKAKELIYRGEDTGEVTLTLFNTVTGSELKIWRKIYANTKSAEYKAWINGEEQSNRYSDANMFNSFVWDTIGITKEDFFSFFLITKENYNPFLLVSDTKKKEIINRFSGADQVDNALPHIQDDSELLEREINEIERELIGNQTRQQVIAEQITEEENKSGEEAKQKLVDQKNEELNKLWDKGSEVAAHIEATKESIIEEKEKLRDKEVMQEEFLLPYREALELANLELVDFDTTVQAELKPYMDHVDVAQKAVDNFQFTRNYSEEYSILENHKKALNDRIREKKLSIPLVKDQFTDQINNIQAEEAGLKQQIREAELELRETEGMESDLAKQLQDSIECPKCHHHFSLRDKSFNYEEAVEQLQLLPEVISEYKQLIEGLKKQLDTDISAKKQAVNDLIAKAGDDIRKEIEVLNDALVQKGNEELTLKQEQQKELNQKQLLQENVNTRSRELIQKKNQIENSRSNLELAIVKAKRELANKQDDYSVMLQQIQNNIRRFELTLKQKEQELQGINDQAVLLEELIVKLQEQAVDRSKIESLETKLTDLIKAEAEIKEQLEAKRKEKESVDAWEVHFKNFKSHLANKSIKNIQDYTNLFLESMGSNLAINIDGYKTLSNKKIKEQITTSVLRDGFEAGSYGAYSGGERGRIDICNIVGMQELISVNAGHGKGLDLLFADEILESVDTKGMECIINSLQTLGRTIMLVSQNDINSLAEHTLTIQKQNKISNILS